MPRRAREKSTIGIYHVMLRGINKQDIFEDDEDRKKLLETIKYYKKISNFVLYGYCLMDNHIHLLVKEMDESISVIVKRISSSYVYWYNQKYSRCGHLFQERYKSEPVEDNSYFLTVLRYILQNPVKAGIVNEIQGFTWCSYLDYTFHTKPVYTDVDFALEMFSTERTMAKKLFESFIKINEESEVTCIEYKEKTILSDREVLTFLHKLGLKNISELQRQTKEKRNAILRNMKRIEGITLRQLSRVTGISKSVIERS